MPEPTEVKEQVQQKLGDIKEQVAGQATGRLEDQKTAASSGIGSVAHAFRQTGHTLRGQEQEGVAQYVEQAADRLEQFSHYLGEHDLRELARDAEQFARREPALFLGGAFAIGMLAARFLKSSGSNSAGDQERWRGQADWYGQAPATSGTRPMLPRTASPAPYTPASSTYTPASSTMSAPRAATTPASPMGGPRTAASSSSTAGIHGTTAGTAASSPGGGSTRGTGMSTSSDVIVGGPPIDDALVGGPPIDRGRETTR
jgi:hypothetical protein